jgi:L-fuculose-phosphate aldolase
METIEHFAKISLVARLLGGERLLTRQEVDRLQGLRGSYGIKAPAPICPDPSSVGDLLSGSDPMSCQVVQSPAGDGRRLVPDTKESPALPASAPGAADADEEIRLTYRELSTLIEDAIRSLR